jgi:hypothetical protein
LFVSYHFLLDSYCYLARPGPNSQELSAPAGKFPQYCEKSGPPPKIFVYSDALFPADFSPADLSAIYTAAVMEYDIPNGKYSPERI